MAIGRGRSSYLTDSPKISAFVVVVVFFVHQKKHQRIHLSKKLKKNINVFNMLCYYMLLYKAIFGEDDSKK